MSVHCCSACGQPLPTNEDALDALPLPRRQRQVLEALRTLRGDWIERERVADFVWGDDPDGGPDLAADSVSAHVSNLRDQLVSVGYDIETQRHLGYRLVALQPGQTPVRRIMRKWSDAEMERLLRLRASGLSFNEIAGKLHRTAGQCQAQWRNRQGHQSAPNRRAA